MIALEQTSSPAHQVQSNHRPKLTCLELACHHRPTFLEPETRAFSRFKVNPCTPYIYMTVGTVFPVNHRTPYTYTNDSTRLPLNHSTSNTYIKDCAHCVLAQSAGGQHTKSLPTSRGSASTFACIAAGGRPERPNPRFHPLKPKFQTQPPFTNPCEGAPSPNQRSTYGGKDYLLSGLWVCASSLANFFVGAK